LNNQIKNLNEDLEIYHRIKKPSDTINLLEINERLKVSITNPS
jgi:hypothetical protein